MHQRTAALLRDHGVKYISPLGEFGLQDGLAILPFEWETVDAFYYMDTFAGIRESHGRPREVLSPSEFREYLFRMLDQIVETGGYISILFHPFLQLDEEKFAVLGEVLDRIRRDEDVWCAPCAEVARWIEEHPTDFGRGKIDIGD